MKLLFEKNDDLKINPILLKLKGKIPQEKGWTSKTHEMKQFNFDQKEYDTGYLMGRITGLLCIDIDAYDPRGIKIKRDLIKKMDIDDDEKLKRNEEIDKKEYFHRIWISLTDRYGWPKTLITRTQSGGYHLYFRYTSLLPTSDLGRCGYIDILSNKRQACDWPSTGYEKLCYTPEFKDYNELSEYNKASMNPLTDEINDIPLWLINYLEGVDMDQIYGDKNMNDLDFTTANQSARIKYKNREFMTYKINQWKHDAKMNDNEVYEPEILAELVSNINIKYIRSFTGWTNVGRAINHSIILSNYNEKGFQIWDKISLFDIDGYKKNTQKDKPNDYMRRLWNSFSNIKDKPFGASYLRNLSRLTDKKIYSKWMKKFDIKEYEKITLPSPFQSLIMKVSEDAILKGLKRDKAKKKILEPIKKYSYKELMDIDDYIDSICINYKYLYTEKHDMKKNLVHYYETTDDIDFRFVEKNINYFGFSNGVLDIRTNTFIYEDEFDQHIITRRYFNQEYTKSSKTPLLDQVLNYQFGEYEGVTNFIYAYIGRCFHIHKNDNFQFMMMLYGESQTGKSIILEVLKHIVKNASYLTSSKEAVFGLEAASRSEIYICDDLMDNVSKYLELSAFLSMTSNGSISVSKKHKLAEQIDNWRVPMIWAGNKFHDYLEESHEVSRRFLVAHYEKRIDSVDTTLAKRIINEEIPNIIHRSITEYHKLLEHNDKSIWDLAPSYFKETADGMKFSMNPHYRFICEKAYYDKDHFTPKHILKDRLATFLNIEKVKNISSSLIESFDNRIKTIKRQICRDCDNIYRDCDCCDKHINKRTSQEGYLHMNLI